MDRTARIRMTSSTMKLTTKRKSLNRSLKTFTWLASLIVSHARVKQWIRQVNDQHRRCDADDGKDGNSHDQVVISVDDGSIKQPPQARIPKNNLGNQRSAEDLPERKRQPGDLRQQGVANDVLTYNAAFGNAAQLGILDITFCIDVLYDQLHGLERDCPSQDG